MNRRNFFNKLAGAVLGCYLAVGYKDIVKSASAINPDWFNAPYEVAFVCDLHNVNTILPIVIKSGDIENVKKDIDNHVLKTYLRLDSEGNIITPPKV